jgi:uncharacterized repeat protein (TIGR03803 family)
MSTSLSQGRSALAAALGCIAVVLSLVQSPAARGQTFTVLRTFNGVDGCAPYGSLTLSDSTLYGMTYCGGSSAAGNIFSMNTNGSGFQSLYSFVNNSTGVRPQGGLTLSGSTLYGMTTGWWSSGYGNVFSINSNGSGLKVLHAFNLTDGAIPSANLTLSGSTLYGMASGSGGYGNGNVFSMNTNGTGFTVLHSFSGADGRTPLGSLTLVGSTLYGTTSAGGSNDHGSIFSINTNGTGFQTLYSFGGTDQMNPNGSLILIGSTLYGTTRNGGSVGFYGFGTVFSIHTDGSDFKSLHSFNGTDGDGPMGALTPIGSTLYGTTCGHGRDGSVSTAGSIFSINTDGTGFQNLYSFNGTDGNGPGDLTLVGSTLYGMTDAGGSSNAGVVFSLTTTPAPEPGTLSLLVSALLGLGVVYLRRRRVKA